MAETEKVLPKTEIPPSGGEHKSKTSDMRMARLAKRIVQAEPEQQKTESKSEVIPQATNEEHTSSSEKDAKTVKTDDAKKVDDQIVKSEQKPTGEEPHQKPPKTIEDWKERATSFQSKFDIHVKESAKTVAERDEKIKLHETTIQELKKRAELVDKFESDPLSILQNYLPEIREKLALQNGNTIGFVEQKVLQVKSSLDKQFEKELGSDWKYNDYEASKPGTPSFRYKLALEGARDSAKDEFKQYVGKQREAIENQRRQIDADKDKLRKEFGFTDEDFVEVQKFADANSASFFNVAKLALIDKIIQAKLEQAKVFAPTKPNSDISSSSGSPGATKPKIQVSEGARKMASRLGRNSFR